MTHCTRRGRENPARTEERGIIDAESLVAALRRGDAWIDREDDGTWWLAWLDAGLDAVLASDDLLSVARARRRILTECGLLLDLTAAEWRGVVRAGLCAAAQGVAP